MEVNEDHDISIIDDTIDVENCWSTTTLSGPPQFHMVSGEASVSPASLHAFQTAYTDLKKRYLTLEKKQLQTQKLVKTLLQRDSSSMDVVSNGLDDPPSGRVPQNGHHIQIRSSGSLEETRNENYEDGKHQNGGEHWIRRSYLEPAEKNRKQISIDQLEWLKLNERYKNIEEENKQLLMEIDTMKINLERSETLRKEEEKKVKTWKEQYQKLKQEFDSLLQQSKTEGKLEYNEDSLGSNFSEELQGMQEQLVQCQQEVRMLRRLVEEQKNTMLEAIKREEHSLREKKRKGSSGRGSMSSGPNSPVPGYTTPGLAPVPFTQGGTLPASTRQRNPQTAVISPEPQTYLGVQESAAPIPDRIAPEDLARVRKWPGQGPQTLDADKDNSEDTLKEVTRQDSDAELKKALEESLKQYKQDEALRKQRQSLSNDHGVITKSGAHFGDSSVPLESSPKVSMVPGSVSYSTRSRTSPPPLASQTTHNNKSQASVDSVGITNNIIVKGRNVTIKRTDRNEGLNVIHTDTIPINSTITDSVFIHDGSGGVRSKILRPRGQSEDTRPVHALEMAKSRPISSSYGDRMEIECRGPGGSPESPRRQRSREPDYFVRDEMPQGNEALAVHIDDIATVSELHRTESLEVLNMNDLEDQALSPGSWHPSVPTENDESEGSPVSPAPGPAFTRQNNLSAIVDSRLPAQLNPNYTLSNNSTRVPSNQRPLNIERNEPHGARPRGYDNAGSNVNLNMGAKDKMRETPSPTRPILNNNPLIEMKNISSRNIFKESDKDRLGGKDARCPNCNMQFSSMMTIDDIQQHTLECNGDSSGEEERACPMCNAVFPSAVPQGEFEQHVNEHFSVNEDFVHLE